MKVWRVIQVLSPALVFLILVSPVLADTSFDMALSWAQKGDLLYSQGQYDQAFDAYNTSVTLDPYNSIAWNKLGETQVRLGNTTGAIRSFGEATRLDPFFGTAWVNRGDELLASGNVTEALDSYNRAISINPNDMRAYISKGMLFKNTGKMDDARAAFSEVITISDREIRVHPNDAKYNADLWDYRAKALSELGRYQEALQAYDRALEINPKHEDAIKNKKELLNALDAQGNIAAVMNPPPTTSPTAKPTTKPLAIPALIPLAALSFAIGFYRTRRRP
ncbi:MAG TPA: tetratricopeptide repeat protein [Methanoregulaceae archaeon]|nr:tetratricopeptide repeat protein [Methanoregulaceae archaeon]